MSKLTAIVEWLKGKKTYILAALGGLVVALSWAGVIDQVLADRLLQIMGFGAIAALRASKN